MTTSSLLQQIDELVRKEPVNFISLVFFLRHKQLIKNLSAKKLRQAMVSVGFIFRTKPSQFGPVLYVSR